MDKAPDQTIDLRGTPCPLNWVKTKLRLEAMEPGELLEVLIDEGEPVKNVPGSVKAEGHAIVGVTPMEGAFKLLIERGASAG